MLPRFLSHKASNPLRRRPRLTASPYALLLPLLYATAQGSPAASASSQAPASHPIVKATTKGKTAPAMPVVKPLEGDQRIIHALNRLGFGPRAGDLERVRAMGLGNWIEQQLAPETIDDSEVERKLSILTTLQMSPEQLTLAYTADTARILKAVLAQRAKQAQMTGDNEMGAMNAMPDTGKKGSAVGSKRLAKFARLNGDMPELNPAQQRTLERLEQSDMQQGTSFQTVGELQNAKILRAVESQRQLEEVLVDFWTNHFNLDVKKGPVRTYRTYDERTAIRPYVLGKFRDLLGASAKSPAMLIYLDNARSTREYNPPARQLRNNQKSKKRGGINENYARELMELHTLGVDGGYTQKDVQEVARCLTGWSIQRDTGEFIFRAFAHDNGEKTVLGQKIPAGGGIEDGEKVLDILASHPSTAHFIAHKLCVRFISDNPPAAVVDRAAKTFLDSGGDLKKVMETIIYSPEFFSTAAYRSKIKSPFEFAVSATRALGGVVQLPDPARPYGRFRLIADGRSSTQLGNKGQGRSFQGKKSMVQEISLMGQPLFSYQAPTGWPEDSSAWVSAGALIARLNFALDLTGNQVSTVDATPDKLVDGIATDDHAAVLQRLFDRLLGGDASASTRTTLQKQMAPGTPVNITKLAALVLGSPEFQRR